MRLFTSRPLWVLGFALCLAIAGQAAQADTTTAPQTTPVPTATPADNTSPLLAPLPPAPELNIEVTARRWVEPLQLVPASVTVVSQQTIAATGAHEVSDVEHLVPNLTLPDFSVRWLNFPYVRGVGAGNTSPTVTTVIDGVPQLSYVTANEELIDPARIEFISGPEGSLYGRNSLAGVLNVVPAAPSTTPVGDVTLSAGDYGLWDMRGGGSGPVGDALVSAHLGYSSRDGYTLNDITDHRLDGRDALFGDAQILFPHVGLWSLRLSVTAEHDHDGDYGLGDLAALRANPWHVAQNFEGFAHRDLVQPVFTAERHGSSIDFTSVTALQNWSTRDRTDDTYTTAIPGYSILQGTHETQQAWLQEFRLASNTPEAKPNALRWLLGAWLFTDKDDATNETDFSAVAAGFEGVPVAFSQDYTSEDHNNGASIYGQWRQPFLRNWALTLGLRDDYEHSGADLNNFTDPALGPPSPISPSTDFNRATPQFSLDYRITPQMFWYASVLNGYKTGGFNAVAPAGDTYYGPETNTTCETGLKTTFARSRGTANLCLFSTQWDDLQLDTPIPNAPTEFYLANVGAAHTAGVELSVNARAGAGVELFGNLGCLNAEFGNGSMSAGENVSGYTLPMAPHFTGHLGVQLSRNLTPHTSGYVRIEEQYTGFYYYDASNTAAQPGYSLVNLHLGAEHGAWRAEAWAKNLFNQPYCPVAFPDEGATQSGYVAETGAPRTIGVSVTRKF